jgi:hypothetical protein
MKSAQNYNNIPFVFGQFEFYFALLYIFHVEYIFIIWGWSAKNIEKGSLVLYCLIFQMFVYGCPNFLISILILSGLMG